MPRWEAPVHAPLTDSQKRRLADALTQGGMPRLFWPGLQRLVEEFCAEAVQREMIGREVRKALETT